MTVEGIDVSHYQGDVQWKDVRAAGKQFAFVKATEGVGEVDPMFQTNRTGARAAGVTIGCYHFAVLSEDASAQASHLCEVAGSTSGELPPALDLESGGLQGSPSAAAVQQWIKTFVAAVDQKLGRRPIIYCPPSFWESATGNSTEFKALPLWIARYTDASSPQPLPGGWKSWTFWQYSSSGSVKGVSGRCDLDRFNGDASALQKLTKS